MLGIRVSINLPYRILMPDGEYVTRSRGAIRLTTTPTGAAPEPRTAVSAVFEVEDVVAHDEIERRREREAKRLLDQVNQLIRSYRAVSLQADVVELSRAQAGPFLFVEELSGALWGGPALEFSLRITPPSTKPEAEIATEVRAFLGSGDHPEVGALNVLDAQHAANSGRFREAVLLAWSAIDATFTQAYERAIGPLLESEYAEGRDFVLGHEIPMKVRMTAMLYLGIQRSLFRDGRDEWAELAASYANRNDVIHRGATASQEDAEKAVRVARRVLLISREF